MSSIQLSASTEIQSANTTTDIKYHSGKENRERLNHKNERIDRARSHKNEELDFYDKDELLEEHYGEHVEKADKNNNSAKRKHGSVPNFLESFEGIEMRNSKGVRWATASQISYIGSKDTLNPLFEEMKNQLNITEEEIIEAYVNGYEDYVINHNEEFPMLRIYHSDIHVDETTYHGHDAMVVMGHTKTGRPTDSVNTALKEKFGYDDVKAVKADDDKGIKAVDPVNNRTRLSEYREINDAIMFNAITGQIGQLLEKHGVEVDFEMIRTGATGGVGHDEYVFRKIVEEKENELSEREEAIDDTAIMQNNRSSAQKKNTQKATKRNKEIDDKERRVNGELDTRESVLHAKEQAFDDKEEERKKKLREADEREVKLEDKIKRDELKDKKILQIKKVSEEVFMEITNHSDDTFIKESRDIIRTEGIEHVPMSDISLSLSSAPSDIINKRKEDDVQNYIAENKVIKENKREPKQHEVEEEDELEM